MTENSAVTTTSEQGLSFGQSNLRPQDIIFPRLKIVQLMSSENSDGSSEAGHFFNTLTLEDMGPVVKVAPIQTVMQRIFMIREERRQAADDQLASRGLPVLEVERDGLACRSFDMVHGRGDPGILCEQCPLAEWSGAGNKVPPLCSEAYNIVAVTELGELVILSFTRSGAKAAKRWFSMIRMVPAAPWTRMYEVSTQKQTGGKGIFWTPQVRRLPEPTPTDVMKEAVVWARQIQGVVIDVTPLSEDDDGADDTGALTGDVPAAF